MKRILIVLSWLLLTCPVPALAHWMPRSEMYVGGVGAGCTMGYVKSVYGEPKEKRWFDTDGVRGVTYRYSDTFSVTGRTGSTDPREEEELEVVGFSLKEDSLATPSGLTVGIPYETVAALFGPGEESRLGGRLSYSYTARNQAVELTFYVDDQGMVTELYEGTEF